MDSLYTVETSKAVDKFLAKHPEISKRYVRTISLLREDPFSPFVDWKQLQGSSGHFRFRIGKYRFLYTVEKGRVLIYIYDADTRGDVY